MNYLFWCFFENINLENAQANLLYFCIKRWFQVSECELLLMLNEHAKRKLPLNYYDLVSFKLWIIHEIRKFITFTWCQAFSNYWKNIWRSNSLLAKISLLIKKILIVLFVFLSCIIFRMNKTFYSVKEVKFL